MLGVCGMATLIPIPAIIYNPVCLLASPPIVTRADLIIVEVNLHRYFDDTPAGWGWFPPANIIKDMAIHYLYNEQTQVILDEKAPVKRPTFEFKFFAFPRMKYVAIRTYGGRYPGGASDKDYKHHAYPFHSLPTYHLPVKPHYAIFDIGKKLTDFFKEDKHTINHYDFVHRLRRELGYELDIDFGMRLFDCMKLYLHWMAPIPPRKSVPTDPFDQAGPDSHCPSSPSRTSQPKTRSATRTVAGTQGSGNELPGTIPSQSHMGALDLPINSCLSDSDEEEDDSSTMTVEEDNDAFLLRLKSWSEDVSRALSEPTGTLQLPSLSPSSSMDSTDSTNSQLTTDIIVGEDG
ncbi:hypothetical protein ONZ45_g15538 [Pleurotus djamor]|nr:hypothetical protein ONZ45_g15538 [Pleurotus djamor]